jgi:hypothetical protein
MNLSDAKKRQLIKTYLLVLLNEARAKHAGQTVDQLLEQMERDVKNWSPEDKKAAREELIWKAHPVKSKVIQ